ncbi:MAG TPA: hypothetical protein VK638_20095 [Edaphobacter sp.]|nr:hypothetical protein [Edaphobacter sp.]
MSFSLRVLCFRREGKHTHREGKADGWRLLFDGKTTDGLAQCAWRRGFPQTGWAGEDGTITVTEWGGEESGNGGDIVTIGAYSCSARRE